LYRGKGSRQAAQHRGRDRKHNVMRDKCWTGCTQGEIRDMMYMGYVYKADCTDEGVGNTLYRRRNWRHSVHRKAHCKR
jgi:hypothetical protein